MPTKGTASDVAGMFSATRRKKKLKPTRIAMPRNIKGMTVKVTLPT